MKIKIKDFIIRHNISWIEIDRPCFKCGSMELLLVRNQRVDASYYAQIYCEKCRTFFNYITWKEYYNKNKICIDLKIEK